MKKLMNWIYVLSALIDILTSKEDAKLFMEYKADDCFILFGDDEPESIEVSVNLTDVLNEYIFANYLSWFDVITSPAAYEGITTWHKAVMNPYYRAYKTLGHPLHQSPSAHHKLWRAKKLAEAKAKSRGDTPFGDYRLDKLGFSPDRRD